MTYEKTSWTNTTPINKENLNKIEEGISANDTAIANMLGKVYPVGSIYISINSTNPSSLFGGTWEQIKDTFLLSAGDTYEAGSTGGEATHELTIEEMPKHSHSIYRTSGDAQSYSFTASDITANLNNYANTNSVGGGKSHNNMPPYLTVYMWKRTA